MQKLQKTSGFIGGGKLALLLGCACVGAGTAFGTVTWSVDGFSGDDVAAAADATGQTAFKTIQAAIDAASAGDAVNIAAGIYDQGGRVESTTGGVCTNRIVITKQLTLVGAGRGKTVIVGKKGTGTYAPLGNDAVRCVLIPEGVTGVTIKNLTLRGGATVPATSSEDSTDHSRRGGGIVCGSDNNWLVDCTIEDCTAVHSGAAYLVRAARTLFRNNCVRAGATGWVVGAISYSAGSFLHCVFVGNGGAALFHGSRYFYNCTFAANAAAIVGGSYNGTVGLYNCVVDCDSNPSSDTTGNLYNSVTEIAPSAATTISDSVTDAPAYSLCAAPALNDVRPLTGSEAIGAGSYAHLKNLSWGGDYRFVDFNGNAIAEPADGKINAGACQASVTPAGGLNLFVARDWNDMSVDGNVTRGNKYSDAQVITNYFRTLDYPSQHRYQAICSKSGNEINYVRAYFNGANTRGYYLPIDTNNACWALAAPAACTNLYYPSKAGVTWIDRNSTASSPDGTASKPYPSFKAACEAKLTADYSLRVFKVKAGVYDNDTASVDKYRCRVPVRRLCWARFIAVDGPEKTIICGAADSSSSDGCGTEAVRCCGSTGTSNYGNGFMHGFTLTGGHTAVGGAATAADDDSRGAVVASSISDDSDYGHWVLTDCIISNNTAGASIISEGTCARCLFADNRSVGSSLADYESAILRRGYVTACEFRNNSAAVVFGQDLHVVHCSVYEPTTPFGYKCSTYDTIAAVPSYPYVYGWFGSVLDGYGTSQGSKILSADPQFVDAAHGDLRILMTSPAVGFGQTDPSKVNGASGRYPRLACGDKDGNPFVFYANGTTIAGAHQKTVVVVQGAATGGRGISPSGDQIPDDGKVTFTATETETRNFLGFAVDGEIVQAASVGTTYTYQVPDPQPTTQPIVTAVYATNWYANASSGDDSASGVDADHAKKTLSAALKYAIAGDVVHAAEGTYDEGWDLYGVEKAHDENATAVTIRTRAVVPEGVTLQADGPQVTTIIAGAAATHDADALGNGPDAIRCVHLSTNSCLRGFTVFNGHTATNEGTNANLEDRTTGGVICQRATTTATIEGCVITNCTAVRDVVGFGGTWSRCVIAENSLVSDYNGILRGAYVRGCLFTKNRGTPIVYYGQSTQSSTFTPDNTLANGTGQPQAISVCYYRTIDNCLFALPMVCDTASDYTFRDCAFLKTGSTHTNNTNNVVSDTCIVDDAVANLDDRGAPMPLVNPAVDAGNAARWNYGDTDACDGQRVYNGTIDIGAVEADWRSVYARFLRNRGLSVDVASSDVAAVVDQGKVTGIMLPAGAALTVTFAARDREVVYEMPVILADGATLTVSRAAGGETVTTQSGKVKLTVPAVASTGYTLSASGGAVTLGAMRSTAGLALIVR